MNSYSINFVLLSGEQPSLSPFFCFEKRPISRLDEAKNENKIDRRPTNTINDDYSTSTSSTNGHVIEVEQPLHISQQKQQRSRQLINKMKKPLLLNKMKRK